MKKVWKLVWTEEKNILVKICSIAENIDLNKNVDISKYTNSRTEPTTLSGYDTNDELFCISSAFLVH